MKVLVTGANGYLGQGIVKMLLDNAVEVIATDITTKYVDSRARRLECNIFNIENPLKYFDEPDIILHLAWQDGFIHNAASHIDNLHSHCRFIYKLVENGAKHIAVMGSMHEVGFFEGSIDENTPCKPMNCYGIAKNALCNYVRWLNSVKPFVYQWLRGYYIVGNSEFGNSVFSKLTAAVKAGKTEFPFTMGLNKYDFIDYIEFCYQVAAVIMQNDVDGIINICSGSPEKLSDRVERFIKENNYNIKLQYGMLPDRLYDSKAIWGNNYKVKKVLMTTSIKKNKICTL